MLPNTPVLYRTKYGTVTQPVYKKRINVFMLCFDFLFREKKSSFYNVFFWETGLIMFRMKKNNVNKRLMLGKEVLDIHAQSHSLTLREH